MDWIVKIFKKGYNQQEMISNLLPTPVMVLLVMSNFASVKESAKLFLGLIFTTIILSNIIATIYRKSCFRSLLNLKESDLSNSDLVSRVKGDTFVGIRANSTLVLLRWGVLPNLIVAVPMLVMGKISVPEIWGMVWLTVSTALISVPLNYSIDLKVFNEFFSHSSIAGIPTKIKGDITLPQKLYGSFILAILYPISILSFLIVYDSIGFLNISENIPGFFLALFVSIAMGVLLARYLNSSIQITVNSLNGAIAGFTDGSISSIKSLAVTTPDELGYLTMRFNTLAQRLQQRSQQLESIGEGDLTLNIELFSKEDELGHSIKEMNKNLKNLMTLITQISQELKNNADTISDSSTTLSQGSTEQAASIEEISSSVQELQAKATNALNQTVEAGKLAQKNRDFSLNGQGKMADLANVVATISESADKMRNIIKTIEDIAFQTNLLALNAAVEAARAGQYGKGFAVVADEVRNLANRSSDSVKETSSMIETVLNQISQADLLASDTNKSLVQIAELGTTVATLVDNVHQAVEDQSMGMSQINDAIDQINVVVQNSAAGSEELASSSQEMDNRANELLEQTNRFTLETTETQLYLE